MSAHRRIQSVPRKKREQPSQGGNGEAAAPGPKAEQGSEGASAYFHRLFQENPRLLKGRSNEEVLRRWLQDHPGPTEVPKPVKVAMANVKSLLRKKGRQK